MSKYWQNRFEILENARNETAKQTIKSVTPAFEQAQAQIEKEINAWYARFADNNEISLQEAKKLLNTRELKEFRWDVQEYIKYGRQNAIDQKWMKELENASARFHISRLEALKIRTQNAAERAFGNELDQIDQMAARIYMDDYYHTAYEIQRGLGIGFDVSQIDQRKLDNIVSKPWTSDKMTFSDRIWKSKTQLLNSLHTELTQMCILGKSPDQAIKNIANRMDVSKNQAGRLVMTEAAYFGSAAQKDCFTDLDVERFEVVATLDNRTSPMCQEMDGKVFDMADFQIGVTAPPFHVWCRSCTAPWFPDNDDDMRAARDADGKTYYVPADMTYKDWKEQFVKDQQSIQEARINDSKPLFDEMQSVGVMRMPTIDEFVEMRYNDSVLYEKLIKRYKNLTGQRKWSAVEFNPETISDHFKRHKSDVGVTTKEEYNKAALKFVNGNNGKIVIVDEDNVRRMYSEQDNLFAVVYPDGTIATFYKPRTGKEYWESQVKKYGNEE